MFRSLTRVTLSAALLAVALPASAQEKPTKVEIAKRGKAATAFVDVPKRGTGTAFCVHPSGLFVTNEHVIRGFEKADLTLVLDPALETQRVLKATVVRADKDADLALLRVEGAKDLPALPLGSVKGVAELADVVAFGFPLGRDLSPDRKDHPAISVNAGTVTSLRQKGGELQFLQIDIALTYGNSGGPVLDENGKVIGVVVSGVAGGGKGINQAIPVNRLGRFLTAPEVVFTPPQLTAAALTKPVEFQARVATLLPDSPEPSLRLLLKVGDGATREFPMTKKDGTWAATAVPIVRSGPVGVEVAVRFGTASISGVTTDVPVKAGATTVNLSEVRQIDFGPKPRVVLANGIAIEREATGLGAVEIALGDQKIRLDLSKATQVTVQPPPDIGPVSVSVVASVGGKEVARVDAPVYVVESRPVTPGTGAGPIAINPPAIAGEKVTKQLPDVFSDVAVGGGGRYLIFQMPKLKKLAVFDVSEAKVTNYIPLAEEKAIFAAGLDAVIVGLPGAGRLERWSLTTFEREKNSSYVGELKNIIMGHATASIVAVDGVFYDPVTLRPLPFKYDTSPAYKGERAWIHAEYPLFASGDGTVYANWNPHLSPSGCGTRVVSGGESTRHGNHDLGHAIPGPDGKWVYTAKGVYSREMKLGSADDAKYGYCLPATAGDSFLSLTSANERDRTGGSFTIYHRGMKGPIGRLEKAEHGLVFDSWGRDPWGPWRRVFFVPDAKVIAVLPVSNDRVVLHKFDIDTALEKSGLDYLLVTSTAPREVKPGGTFSYPLVVKSKHGGLAFKLDSGPKGMAVSAAGVVTWVVPAATAAGDQDVILTVKDKAGQETFHTFAVKVVK
jgi:hypothetical protein